MKIILASNSPRRKELLKQILSDFDVLPANIDENKYSIENIAFEKAKAISKKYPNDLIISADTIVIIDSLVLGKPKDKNDAKKMLNMLSNKKHNVITNYCIYCPLENINIQKSINTEVFFNKLDEHQIDAYIASLSPLDKAGAYGIQDKEYNLVKYISGSENNVIGLPIEFLKEDLIKLGIITK